MDGDSRVTGLAVILIAAATVMPRQHDVAPISAADAIAVIDPLVKSDKAKQAIHGVYQTPKSVRDPYSFSSSSYSDTGAA